MEGLAPLILLAGFFAPPAGQVASDAVAAEDAEVATWATGVDEVNYGERLAPQWQKPGSALGPAEANAFDIVALGAGGSITLTFDPPLADGPGWDLAVFENSFSDVFLEVAFVEVSSDGENFVRFPATSLTESPVAAFGTLDATDLHNLAGKYRQGFGTPFDFAELIALSGGDALELSRISHVRIIDIVGDGRELDANGNPIYDPYPTQSSAGFDLDAVAGRYVVQPEPRYILVKAELQGDALLLSWAAEESKSYIVESSEDLQDWADEATVLAESSHAEIALQIGDRRQLFARVREIP